MDLTSNALTKIRNASLANKKTVDLRSNKVVRAIVKILKSEEFIIDYKENDGTVTVDLGYDGKIPKISQLQKVSKPGQRIYVRSNQLRPVLSGRGIGIISTSSGVMTIDEAKAKKLGGEYICKIW
jgi:small subunit ribosomal protein S8